MHLHALDGLNVMVDLVDNPAEEAAIERLGQRVSHVAHLDHVALASDLFAARELHVRDERVVEFARVHLDQSTHGLDHLVVLDLHGVVVVVALLGHELDLANEQNAHQNSDHILHVLIAAR